MPRGIPNKKPDPTANNAAAFNPAYDTVQGNYMAGINDFNAAAMQNMAAGTLPPVGTYDPYAPRHPLPEQEVQAMISRAQLGIPEPQPIKTARVKLDRHYAPMNEFVVVGHTRPEIKKKNPAGREEIFQTEEWIPGEMMPAAIAGTGFKNKVWAGTVIEIAETEAKSIVKQKIGSLEFAD